MNYKDKVFELYLNTFLMDIDYLHKDTPYDLFFSYKKNAMAYRNNLDSKIIKYFIKKHKDYESPMELYTALYRYGIESLCTEHFFIFHQFRKHYFFVYNKKTEEMIKIKNKKVYNILKIKNLIELYDVLDKRFIDEKMIFIFKKIKRIEILKKIKTLD